MRQWKHHCPTRAAPMSPLETSMISTSTNFFARKFAQCKKSRWNKDFLHIKILRDEFSDALKILPSNNRKIGKSLGLRPFTLSKIFFHRGPFSEWFGRSNHSHSLESGGSDSVARVMHARQRGACSDPVSQKLARRHVDACRCMPAAA
jgi:hypothetical protein